MSSHFICTTSFALIFISLSTFSSLFAQAQTVTKVKDGRILIDLEGTSLPSEQTLFLVDSSNRKKAQIEVQKQTSKQAVAKLVKGTAKAGYKVLLTKASVENAAANSTFPKRSSKWSVGFMTGLSQQTIALTVVDTAGTTSEGTTLSGSSYPLKVFADYNASPRLNLRMSTGLEPFNTKGSLIGTLCEEGTSSNCRLIYNYWALEGQAQYNISVKPRSRFWLGGGLSYLNAVGSSVNVPNVKTSSSSNTLLLVGVGIDLAFSAKSYLPIAFEYGTYPGSTAVKASATFFRIGYGIRF